MTADNTTAKSKYHITIMRPVFQVAVLEIEAMTRDEAIEFAQEREERLKETDWKGPFERAIYDEDDDNGGFRATHPTEKAADMKGSG